MTLGIILQLLFGILASVGQFLASFLWGVQQTSRRVASFVFSIFVSLASSLPGTVAAVSTAIDAFSVIAIFGNFADSLINLTPVSILAFFRPVQQLMFALSGVYGKTFIVLLSTGAITAPLLLHGFPFVQDCFDENWCYIFQFETYLDFLVSLIAEVYNVVVPIFDYLTSWLLGRAIDILIALFPLVIGGAQIFLRVFFDYASVLVPPSHNGQCTGYLDPSLFPSAIEQILCLVKDIIRLVVNDVILNSIEAIPVVGPIIEPLAHDLVWLYVDLIVYLNSYILGGPDFTGCIIPSPLSASGCWVCSLGAPPGPSCCAVASVPCIFIRFFAFGQHILDIIFLLLESIPGIGDVLKFIAKLGQLMTDIVNKYIINPIDIVLTAILKALVASFNAVMSFICIIARGINDFCAGCLHLHSGPYCGWDIPVPTHLIAPITFPIPELSGATSGLPPALGGRRLMDATNNSSSYLPLLADYIPVIEPYTGISDYFVSLKDTVHAAVQAGPQRCSINLPTLHPGLHGIFHPQHFAIDKRGCTALVPVLHSEVRHPDYPGYEDPAPPGSSAVQALAPAVGTSLEAQRRLLGVPTGVQAVGDASPVAKILKQLVIYAGAYISIGLKMQFVWTVTSFAPALGVLPSSGGGSGISGSAAIGDLQNAVVQVARAFQIPNKNAIGQGPGQSAVKLFDPRTWVTFLSNDVLIQSSGVFTGVPDIATITTQQLSDEMIKLDQWADNLILNNLQALTMFLQFLEKIFKDLLSLNLQAELGLLANIYKQIECDSPGTFDQRLRPHGVWGFGCLLHGQLRPTLPIPLLALPERIVWGVQCLNDDYTCKGFGGVTHLTSQGVCIKCKCVGAKYALCDTVYPSGMHLLSGLISGIVEKIVFSIQGAISAETILANGGMLPAGSENGLEYGVPQFINLTVPIFIPIPFVVTINIGSVRLVTLFPLLQQFLELGIDANGASITRAALSGVLTFTPGSTPISTPTIGINAGIACIFIRFPAIFWALVVIVAWVAAYFGAIVLLFEIGLIVSYLLYGVVGLAASLLAWFFVALSQVGLAARLTVLETSVATLQGQTHVAAAAPGALPTTATAVAVPLQAAAKRTSFGWKIVSGGGTTEHPTRPIYRNRARATLDA